MNAVLPNTTAMCRLPVLASLAICLFTCCFSSAAQASPALAAADASGPQPTKIRVGYIPIAECAHLYVGIAKKYFEREGLEIDLQPMSGGAVILPAAQKGDLDIGFTNVASIVILNSKLPLRDPDSFVSLAGASYERQGSTNHALLIKHGSQLSVGDLAKPRIRVSINTTRNIEELMLRRYLSSKGVKNETLIIVPLAFPDMLSALERGDVDVVSEVEPFIVPAIRSGKASLLAHQYLDVSSDTVVATYGVTRKWLSDNPDKAERFVRAFEKTNEFMKSNDAETRQIIGSFTRIAKADLPIIGMPAFEPAVSKGSLRELVNQMKHFGFIQNDYSAADIIVSLKK